MAIKKMETAGSNAKLLKDLEAFEKEFAKVEQTLADCRRAGAKLPDGFREMHPGQVHNLTTPDAYNIWVGIENLKAMYSVTQEMNETKKWLASVKKNVQTYKKP